MPNSPGLFFKKGASALTPASVAGLTIWYEADSGITKSYSTTSFSTGREVTGTSGTNTLVSAGDCSASLFASSKFQVNATDIYTVSSISTSVGISTITTVETLSTNYSNNSIGIERITQFNDQSTNAYNATGSAGTTAIYLPTASNNKPAILFNATNNFMTMPSGVYSLAASNNTVFVVAKSSTQDVGFRGTFSIYNNGTTDGIHLEFGNAGSGDLFYTAGPSSVSTGNITQTNFGILRGRRNGTTIAVSLNDSTEITDTTGSNITADKARIGDVDFGGTIVGQIQAIVVYNVSLTVPNIAIVNNYLKAKYGTP